MYDPTEYIPKIQQLRVDGKSQREVAKALSLSKGTVARYWRLPNHNDPEELELAVRAKLFDLGRVKNLGGAIVNRFLFDPKRVTAFLEVYYKRSLSDTKVMLDYMNRLVPNQTQGGSNIMININTPLLKPDPRTYGVDGNPIDE